METSERCVVRHALFTLLAASSILLLLISPVMPAFWSFLIAEFGGFEYLLISFWLVMTLVFLEKPFVSQLGKCDLMKLNSAGREIFSENSSAQ